MVRGKHAQLFETQAQKYATYRPTYPQALYDRVYQSAQLPSQTSPTAAGICALDVGTGSGQVAKELAKTFQKVIAIDPSESQLAHAVQAPNIEYHQGCGEHLEELVPTASVDLATVGQALHWLDIPAFYKEMRRVLKPTGSLAIWTYALSFFLPIPSDSTYQNTTPHLHEALQEMSSLLEELCSGTLGPYWDARRVLVDTHYQNVLPTEEDFGVIEHYEVDMDSIMSLGHFVGYLRSWSAYVTFKKTHPRADDPIDVFAAKAVALLLGSGEEASELKGRLDDDFAKIEEVSKSIKVRVKTPLYLIMAKQPQALESVQ